MEIKRISTPIHPKIKTVLIKKYNYSDVINFDNAIGNRKVPYVDSVLRKRINHVQDTHSKGRHVKGMAVAIFFEYIKVILHHLFDSRSIALEGIGVIQLKTMKSSTRYDNKAKKKDRIRSRNMGTYTKIFVTYDKNYYSRFRYHAPFWSLGETYKNKLHTIENTGRKF